MFQEVTQGSISVSNITLNLGTSNPDIASILQYFNIDSITSLHIPSTFTFSSTAKFSNLVEVGFRINHLSQITAKRSIKSSITDLFDPTKITSVTYYMPTLGGTVTNFVTTELFPNDKSITIGSGIYTIDDGIIKDFTGTLT